MSSSKRKLSLSSSPMAKQKRKEVADGHATPSKPSKESNHSVEGMISLLDDAEEDYTVATPTPKSATITKPLPKIEANEFALQVAEAIVEGGSVVIDGKVMTPGKSALNYSDSDPVFVHFFIGPDKKKFTIHKVAICHNSEHFGAKLKNPSTEEYKTLSFNLPDMEPEIFGYFNNWVYVYTLEHVDAPSLNTVQLAKLYIFAYQFKIEKLARDTIINLFSRFNKETEAPIPGQDHELPEFLDLAFRFGPTTRLANMATDRMVRLAMMGKAVEAWLPYVPEEMRLKFQARILQMVRMNKEKLKGPPFQMENYL